MTLSDLTGLETLEPAFEAQTANITLPNSVSVASLDASQKSSYT